MMRSKPLSPQQRVAQYVEHAVQFNVADNLDMHGRHLSFFQLYSLDIVQPLVMSLIVVCFILTVEALRMLRFIRAFAAGKPKAE